VHGDADGRAAELTSSIPIKSEFAKNTYIFPLRGTWCVGWGSLPSHGTSLGCPRQICLRYCETGRRRPDHKGDGTRFEDYYAYGVDVLAAAGGRVVGVANDESEDLSAMQRPNESQEA